MKLCLKKLVSMGLVVTVFAAMGFILPKGIMVSASTDKIDAVPIELGEEIEDSISVKTEEDWYTFTTPITETQTDSWFEVKQSFHNKQEYGSAPSIYIYNEKDKELGHFYPKGENEEAVDYIYLEQEETYYVMLTSEYKNDTADYRFSITQLVDEAGESLEASANLEKNITNRFELQSQYDEDWFYAESDITKPTLIVKNANVVSFRIGIYDIDGIKLDEFGVGKVKSETFQLNLEDKNFYVRVDTEYNTEESKGNYTIAVNDQVMVTKVSLNRSKAELKVGRNLTLKATVTPSKVTDKSVTWKSSNTKIATVNKNGKIYAKKAGTVTISCSANDGSKKKATCKITVK